MKFVFVALVCSFLSMCCANEDIARDHLLNIVNDNKFQRRAVVNALNAGAIRNAARGFAANLGSSVRLGSPVSKSFEDACLGNDHVFPPWRPYPLPLPRPYPFPRPPSPQPLPFPGPILRGLPSPTLIKRSETDRLANRDIVFVLDTSGSIPQDQFDKATKAINILIESFCPSEFGNRVTKTGTKQISVVLFGATVTTEVDFSDSARGLGYLQDKIKSMRHRKGHSTATGDALTYVKNKVLGKGSSRLNNPKVSTDVIVITDGQCNHNCRVLRSESQAIREMGHGVNVFAMGVANARACELEIITGKGNDVAFGLGDFTNFDKFALAIRDIAEENESGCA